MAVLTITVEGSHSDLEFVRTRYVGMVEEAADEDNEAGHLDGQLDVGWEFEG